MEQPQPQQNGDENSQGKGHDKGGVSQTPVVATVPDVVGEDKDTARQRMTDAGLRVKLTETRSDEKPGTVVRTGHGDSTTIGDEAPHLEEWIARGH